MRVAIFWISWNFILPLSFKVFRVQAPLWSRSVHLERLNAIHISIDVPE
jgi:hypothetical protein